MDENILLMAFLSWSFSLPLCRKVTCLGASGNYAVHSDDVSSTERCNP